MGRLMGETANSRKFLIPVWIAAFVCLLVFFWLTSRYVSEIVDDAFISFRYARNFAEGEGLVFNKGERVEGYTNFLWVLIMAAGHKAGFDLPRLSQNLSILCATLLVLAVALFSKFHFRELPHWHVSCLAPALLALNPLYLEHIRTGLETLLFSLLMFLSLASYLYHDRRRGFPYLTGLLLGLGYLTRPETLIWAFSFVAVDLAWAISAGEKLVERMPRVVKYAGAFALVVASHMIWRVSYYGDWLPNTYYAKGASNWAWGLLLTAMFMLSSGFLPLIVLATGPFLLRKKWAACMCAVISLTFLHNLRVGGDFIFTGRFLFPLLPLIYILAQELFRLISMRIVKLKNNQFGKKIFFGALQAGILMLFIIGTLRDLHLVKEGVAFCRELNRVNMRVAECILENTEPSDTIAVMAAGVVPYYTERNVIDMLGLNDKHIARRGITDKECTIGHQKADSDYVLDRKPEVILLAPPDPILRELTPPLYLNIAANNRMHENPRLLELYEETDLDCDVYPIRIFVRKTVSQEMALAQE